MSYELKRIRELYEFYSNTNDTSVKRRYLTEAYNLISCLDDDEKTHPIIRLIEDLYREYNSKYY